MKRQLSIPIFILLVLMAWSSLAWGQFTDDLIPPMTSTTAPSGVASASPEGTQAFEVSWNSFRDSLGAGWQTAYGNPTGYLQYQFTSSKTIEKYTITGNNFVAARGPKDWTFEGSNNGTSWTVLDTQSGITWVIIPANDFKEFTFTNSTAYTHYRINISANGGDPQLSIMEMEMMESNSGIGGINDNKVKAGSDGLDTAPGFLEDKINGGYGITVSVPVSGAVDQNLTISAQDQLSIKGDLLTNDGTSDVSLGVGIDGQVLISDSGATEGVRWSNNASSGSNLIINGGFRINQRGASGTVTLAAGLYGHDRWKAGSSGATYTFSTFENVTTITITAGSLQQVVEGINLYSGNHALSWEGTAEGSIAGGAFSSSGVVGTITGGVNTTVEFNTGTISEVQLEVGSVATDFEIRNIAQELMMAQRYYQSLGKGLQGDWYHPTRCHLVHKFSPIMRAAPTITLLTTSFSMSEPGIAYRSTTTGTFLGGGIAATKYGMGANIGGFSGATPGWQAVLNSDNVLGADAEL